ncbi:hypothetical protein K505DRAFT_344534 [Melanomma pulvis-pyrius CBS 109.77]|uniref:Uncharacterized protein n=1 Tax=Melanomma pulvis-pyrius CBS 109.77 TaxID=1314802 RepID=A0A6A6WNU0_9PLEO|nr:hypothetical protein K505DRAFT_344534 [Melanomma pulvis-pyrius CBS 109.77]
MQYHCHHPTGNAIVRTPSHLIALDFQRRGWVVTRHRSDSDLEKRYSPEGPGPQAKERHGGNGPAKPNQNKENSTSKVKPLTTSSNAPPRNAPTLTPLLTHQPHAPLPPQPLLPLHPHNPRSHRRPPHHPHQQPRLELQAHSLAPGMARAVAQEGDARVEDQRAEEHIRNPNTSTNPNPQNALPDPPPSLPPPLHLPFAGSNPRLRLLGPPHAPRDPPNPRRAPPPRRHHPAKPRVALGKGPRRTPGPAQPAAPGAQHRPGAEAQRVWVGAAGGLYGGACAGGACGV